MAYTLIDVTITEWITYTGTRYLCSCYADNNGEHEFRSIDHDTACRIMWELVAKGATKTTTVNPYTPHCSTTEVRYLHLD